MNTQIPQQNVTSYVLTHKLSRIGITVALALCINILFWLTPLMLGQDSSNSSWVISSITPATALAQSNTISMTVLQPTFSTHGNSLYPTTGDTITYTYIVTNLSVYPYLVASLVDNQSGVISPIDFQVIPPLSSKLYVKARSFTVADNIIQSTNILTISGAFNDPAQTQFVNSVTNTIILILPRNTVSVTVRSTFSTQGNLPYPSVGDTITYTYILTNWSWWSYFVSSLRDSQLGMIISPFPIQTISPLSFNTYTKSHVVTITDTNSSLQLTNVITVVGGFDIGGQFINFMDSVTNTVNLSSPPPLILSPSNLTFNATTNMSLPPNQSLNIQTGLNWTANESIGWLDLDKTAGGAPSTINVSLNSLANALPPGVYTGSIRIDTLIDSQIVNVTLNLAGILNVQVGPSSINFGSQILNTTSIQSFIITNSGNLPIYIGNITTNNSDFIVTNTVPITLFPGVTLSSIITFKPTVLGNRTGTLSINTNAPSSPNIISLSGVGVNPIIAVSPTQLTFNATTLVTMPITQTLSISNGGTGSLTWSASESLAWLSLSSISDTAPSTVGVSVNSSGLSAGTYTGTITISSNGGNQTVTTTLTVNPPAVNPTLQVSPTNLTFNMTQGGSNPTALPLNVTNSGTGSLTWSASESLAWLSLSSSSGTAPSAVNVSIDGSGLSAGTYTGTITISSNGGNQTVTTTLTVNPPAVNPTLQVSPPSLIFNMTQGGSNPTTLPLNVTNGGTGSLTWSASESLAWLSLSSSSGTAPSTVNVSIDGTGLSAGTYTGTITISSNGGNKTVNVTLNVTAPTVTPGPGKWVLTGNLTENRSKHSAVVLNNGQVMVIGGDNSPNGTKRTVELYDLNSGTWHTTTSMNNSHANHASVVLPDGRVLVVGGNFIKTAEIYDPNTEIWSLTGNVVEYREGHTATLLPNGQVLVAGGNFKNSAELYDPTTNTWTATGTMNFARGSHTATLLPNGKVLVAGGQESTYERVSAELYDPTIGTWSTTGSMAEGRYSYAAVLLPNGKVLVMGGRISFGVLNGVELYDPATETWSKVSSMPKARYDLTATLLKDGRVLVAGGYNSGVFKSSLLYDPSADTWSSAGDMSMGRDTHTANLLNDGKVLVASAKSAEYYEPGIAPTPNPTVTPTPIPTTPPVWALETILSGTNTYKGRDNSIALDKQGYPHLVYVDHTDNSSNLGLKHSWHDGTIWHHEVITTQNIATGHPTSIKIDQAGHIHVLFVTGIVSLYYAYYDGTSWSIEKIDSNNTFDLVADLAIDTANRPHIVYTDGKMYESFYLMYAYKDGDTWRKNTITSGSGWRLPNEAFGVSIALDSQNRPYVSMGGNTLMYAYINCNRWETHIIDNHTTINTVITIDNHDQPHIAYLSQKKVKYIRYNGQQWSSPQEIDTIFNDDTLSFQLDKATRPHIVYARSGFNYAWHDGGKWNIEPIVDFGTVSYPWADLAIDQNGQPRVSFYAGDKIQYAYHKHTMPFLYAYPSAFEFRLTAGQGNPANQKLTLLNAGVGQLVWTTTHQSSWLNLPGSGTTPTTSEVSVNATGLAPGIYHETLVITTTTAQNSPQSIPVTLIVDRVGYTGSLISTYPGDFNTPNKMMQGGATYRYLKLTDPMGAPVPNAQVKLSTGRTFFSDNKGYITTTLCFNEFGQGQNQGAVGLYDVTVTHLTTADQGYDTQAQIGFKLQMLDREHEHGWGFGVSAEGSVGFIAYATGKVGGGLEVNYKNVGQDEDLYIEHLHELEKGNSVGIEAGLGTVNVEVSSKVTTRDFGHVTTYFPEPELTEVSTVEGTLFLLAVLDHHQKKFSGIPLIVAVVEEAIKNHVPIEKYISERQTGFGINGAGYAKIGLGFPEGMEQNIPLSLDAVGVSGSILNQTTWTKYEKDGEIGFGNSTQTNMKLTALSIGLEQGLEFGNGIKMDVFEQQLMEKVNENAQSIEYEVFVDAQTRALKRVEISIKGDDAKGAFTYDVDANESIYKLIIPAEELTPDVLAGTINLNPLVQATITKNGTQRELIKQKLGYSQIISDLQKLLPKLNNASYEVVGTDGNEKKYSVSLPIKGILVSLSAELNLTNHRRLVYERGTYIQGTPYLVDTYVADDYVASKPREWDDIINGALDSLWKFIGGDSVFNVAVQAANKVGVWSVKITVSTGESLFKGSASLIGKASTIFGLRNVDSNDVTPRQLESVQITAVAWESTQKVNLRSLGVSPIYATASGSGFSVGGIYQFQPYTLTIEPAATLVITYPDPALSLDESKLRMFRWNEENINWQPIQAEVDVSNNTLTTQVTQLGTFAVGYDNTSPQINITSPIGNSSVQTGDIPVVASIIDEGVGIVPTTVQMQVDGQLVAASYITSTGELTYLPPTPLATGQHIITVSASDTLGNVGNDQITFYIGEVVDKNYLPLIVK